MIGTTTQLQATPQAVDAAVQKAAYKSFANAAASIRKEARASIVRSRKPSAAGSPVHTRRGLAKRSDSILFHATKEDAIIGFAGHAVDEAMQAHEHGGERFGTQYPARPTMAPALTKNLDRFHREWEHSL
jgi:hypothetical protein